jgi:hypothetical protein
MTNSNVLASCRTRQILSFFSRLQGSFTTVSRNGLPYILVAASIPTRGSLFPYLKYFPHPPEQEHLSIMVCFCQGSFVQQAKVSELVFTHAASSFRRFCTDELRGLRQRTLVPPKRDHRKLDRASAIDYCAATEVSGMGKM